MLSDARTQGTAALPPRAGIALLTLQLRAALQDAADAEAAAVVGDDDAAREELRGRLEPLLDERRRVLDAALVQARVDAAGAVAAAHRAASVMLAQAAAQPPVVEQPPAVEEPAIVVQPAVVDEPAVVEPAPIVVEAAAIETAVVQAVGALAMVENRSSLPVQQVPINVVIDAEAFAKVFATVFASMLDERASAWGGGMAGRQAFAPAPAPVPAKQSFWTHARHPDVLLMGLAMVIVLVVLAAWLG